MTPLNYNLLMQLMENPNYSDCGYIRNPKINQSRTRIEGICALTDERCHFNIPMNVEDCVVYQRRFGK